MLAMADEAKTDAAPAVGKVTKSENGNLTIIEVTTAEFDDVLNANLGHPRLFSFFTGAVKEATGKSWYASLH